MSMSWSGFGRRPRVDSRGGPTRDGRQSQVLETHSAQAHARELLRWLQSHPDLSNVMLTSDEIRAQHRAMCDAHGWRERAWNPVAMHLRSLTTGRKVYDLREIDGRMRRVRVYPIVPT